MGIFKDMNDLKKMGKDAAKAQGKPTGLRGSIADMKNTIADAKDMIAAAGDIQAGIQREQELLASGLPGRATVTSLQPTGAMINMSPQVVLGLDVSVDGHGDYSVEFTTAVPQPYLPQVQPGSSVAVRVDPADKTGLALDWARQASGA